MSMQVLVLPPSRYDDLKNQLDTPQVGGELSPSPRRIPVQGRSHQTVQRVLDAASSLLEQMPLEDVTTTRIAAEAGLSIGALYRFFPDKQTIIDAIAVRHVEQFRASLEDTVMKTIEREFANLETFDPARSSTASWMPTSFISTRIPTSARSRSAVISARPPKSARHRRMLGCLRY